MSTPARLVVSGRVRVPGDKSISHRALIFGALAEGESRVRAILRSADVESTAGALRALGVEIPPLGPDIVVRGHGPEALRSPAAALDCGNSGTTTRLLAGVMAGLPRREARFEGDESLSRRPMRRVASPLTAMGARVDFEGPAGHDGLPMRVHGASLHPIAWDNTHASAQIKSAILLAALTSGAHAVVHEPHRSRDHTERMLLARGVSLRVDERSVEIAPSQRVGAADVEVPGDPSSAAFFLALAALADEGTLELTSVCLNPSRTGAIDVLRRMGASIHVTGTDDSSGETVGTIVASASSLVGTRIDGAEIPRCIDELPLIACVAACAQGETVIADAAELRVKESDRIRAVVENLRALGAEVEETPDGMRIAGRGAARPALRGRVITHGDHRLAMAFGILATLPGNAIAIDDPNCVAVSYPEFWADLARAIGPVPAVEPRRRASDGSVAAAAPAPVAPAAVAPAVTRARRLVIAIDGPAASGKSSTAQWVAQELGVRHVDSGAFYRALTHVALESGVEPEGWSPATVLAGGERIGWRLTDRSVLPVVDGAVVDDALRGTAVTQQVFRVATMREARAWVNARVREASLESDVVVDGRDIGTAVFPDAPLKVFLVADPWERARRRLIQRLGRSPRDAEIAEETEALVLRDARDATQSAPARDAVTIDTTTLTQVEQVERIVALAHAARERMWERPGA